MALQVTRAPNLPASLPVFDHKPSLTTVTENTVSGHTHWKTHSLPSLPLFLEARSHGLAEPLKAAIIDKTKSEEFTYSDLLSDVATFKTKLQHVLKTQASSKLDTYQEEPRIAFLVPAGYDYVVAQWAIWAIGAVCVPLCMSIILFGGWEW